MAFTRYCYDDCRIQKYLEESKEVGNYYLNVPGNGVNPYFFDDPNIRMQMWGGNLSNNKTLIENDLFRKNNYLNRDENIKTNNYNNYLTEKNIITNNNNNNYSNSITNESRSSHPAWEIRTNDSANQVNNFNYLLFNPQENVCFNFNNNISTRILEKDYFKYKNSI